MNFVCMAVIDEMASSFLSVLASLQATPNSLLLLSRADRKLTKHGNCSFGLLG